MSEPTSETAVRFHLSLNVADLNRSVAFYRALFGMEATKCHDDYAKFDLVEPPVVFSLAPRKPGAGGSLSHLGLRVPDAESLETVRRRLEAAGLPTQCQDDTVCGYARQNKVWVRDPDGNFWEVYQVEAEIDPAEVRRSFDGAAPVPAPAAVAPVSWEHYVSEAPPERIPHADGTLDEVRLTGTFNAPLDEGQVRRLALEAWRVLKPGGKVVTHGLMGDRALGDRNPSLPGLAALVARVPGHLDPLAVLRDAGFVGLQYVKFTEAPWFVVDGVELREVKLVGFRPAVGAGSARAVIYKGPFRRATDEAGTVYRRGERTEVPAAVWESLRTGPAAAQFVFIGSDEGSACGAG